MEEELLKRNTDCVYFLASPFTCKKGADCEYRHSDMARLNPRDCWYWLSGNCLNPACAFRHPPLEIHSEASSEAAPSSLNQPSAPVTKATVPCYFYFNGFCNKGDRCPFLHENEETYSWKPKLANTVADVSVSRPENRTSGKSDAGSAPANKHPGPSETAIASDNSLQIQWKEQVQKSTSKNSLELNSSARTYASGHKDAAAIKRMSLQSAEGLTKTAPEPSLGSEHSSEELVDGDVVRDEWWESSPGFDVLVDGKTDDMASEDDPEYMHALEGNDEDRECLFMQEAYVDQIKYGERGFIEYDPYECLDGEDRADTNQYSPRRALDRKVGQALSHKRKLLSMELPVCGRNNVDLRDYLRKRRTVDSYLEARALERDFTCLRDERRDRLEMRAMNHRLPRRIASKVERNGVGLVRRRTSVVSGMQRGKHRNLERNELRRYNGIRRHPLSSESLRRSFSKSERSPQYSISFAGPKSLAEIKKARRVGHSTRNGSVDFKGPKPLSEILKYKKKTTSSQNGCVDSSS